MVKSFGTRIEILTDSEISELYSVPAMAESERQYFFSLNDSKLAIFESRDSVIMKVYYVLLLGYFKYKPMIWDFTQSQVKDDLDYILQRYLPNKKLPRKGLSRPQKGTYTNQVRLDPNYFGIIG